MSDEKGRARSPHPKGGWHLPPWWPTAVNVGLGCLVGGELIALLLVFTRPLPTVPLPQLPPPGVRSEQPSTDSSKSTIPLVSVGARPLFQTPSQRHAPHQTVQASSDRAKTLAARLTLVGIMAGDPAQAIIEDPQTQKAHFVTVGQHLIEGLIVEEIREDRVLLDLNGEKIELSL